MMGASAIPCGLRAMNIAKTEQTRKEAKMGRGILLWLIGVPIPIIILLALFWH